MAVDHAQQATLPTKDAFVIMRVTPRMKLRLQSAAADAGESLSEYIRTAAYARLPAHLQPDVREVRE